MIAGDDRNLLTITEAAGLLRISPVTLRRWLKSGRLRAVRVGARALRVRRNDALAALQPVPKATTPPNMAHHSADGVAISSAAIRPHTVDEQRRALAALERAHQRGMRILERRDGRPLEESWIAIREAREQRSQPQA